MVRHGNYTATCSVTIRKTGKWVDLGFFTVILHFASDFMTGNFWDPSQVKFISPVRQFHEKANSLMVIPPKYGKI